MFRRDEQTDPSDLDLDNQVLCYHHDETRPDHWVRIETRIGKRTPHRSHPFQVQ